MSSSCTASTERPCRASRISLSTTPSDWTREFTARYLDALGDAQLEVRAGRAEDHAVEVCDAVGADIILLGWHRRPAPSRARTVRAILEHSAVPVMLLPKRTRVSRA